MPHLHIRGTTESDGPKADVLGPLPPCSDGMEAAPPADDVTARREVQDHAGEHNRGEVGLAWRTCAELPEMGRRAGDVFDPG